MPYYARVESTLRRDWGKAMEVVAEGLRDGVHEAVTEGAQEARASRRFRDRTGKLYRSIRGKLDSYNRLGAQGTLEAGVQPKALYAIFIEKGTKAHFIQARRARALRWIGDGGRAVFAKKVRHPGTRADSFMSRGATQAASTLSRAVDKAVEAGARVFK